MDENGIRKIEKKGVEDESNTREKLTKQGRRGRRRIKVTMRRMRTEDKDGNITIGEETRRIGRK